ncbi:MAG TPA: sugar phosphate nucleotidyltransferase, partial [Patescibacteria group bacterium]|nr:sugar phosphate nucleotidyltransferase [Patescibacteria group bacterium]
QAFVESKNYLWNSGMFLFSAGVLLNEYTIHADKTLKGVRRALEASGDLHRPDAATYAELSEQPFDKAIMERSNRVAVVPCNPGWSDIGSWESLWEIHQKDDCGNVIQGRAACHKTSNCLIQANTRLIACAGLENLVVIETPDALLIADRRNGDAMRSLVRMLKSAGCAEVTDKPGAKRAPRPQIRPAVVASDFAVRPITGVSESPAIYTPPPSNPQGPREVA